MSSDLKTYIQEVPLLTEQQARLLKGKIYNRPMSIPYKVDNTVYFLTPIVKNSDYFFWYGYCIGMVLLSTISCYSSLGAKTFFVAVSNFNEQIWL